MAESNDEQFVPEILTNPDDVKFAKDVVDYVMLRNSPIYAHQRGWMPSHESTHTLDQITRRAVQFIEYILEISDNTFRKMLKANSICGSAYETFVQKGAVKYLTTDFDAKQILIFCVTMSRIAALFYNNGISDAPNIAIKHISSVLRRYSMTTGEWDALRRVAQQLDNLLREHESMPLIADSGEIEPLRSSKKVIGYGSMNVLPSREHNVLSNNEENNLEQKQDCVCSKLEILLEKIAQYFSGKSTDIGLSPLKEPESPLEDSSAAFNFEGNESIIRSGSNVKLLSGTSKTDQKSDLTETEHELIMDKCVLDDGFIPGPSSSCQKSDLSKKSDCRGELDTGINAQDNKHSERLTVEGDEFIDRFSSTEGFLMDTSNTYQTSSFTSVKENIDLPSGEKNGANYSSAISVENKLANKPEPGEKLVSEAPDSGQTSKRSLDISSYKETNANAKNAPVKYEDEEESPKLKDT